jgi:hypothetical protein
MISESTARADDDTGAGPAGEQPLFDYARWEAQLPELTRRYDNDHPFPHIILENLISPEIAKRAVEDFPSAD